MNAKGLRASVLQQAVEGRLVPQDPADEPASELLARIRQERRELVREKKAKRPRGGESVIERGPDGSFHERRLDARGRTTSAEAIDDQLPFDIPDTWEWARLGSLASFTGGGTPSKDNPAYWGGEIPWASIKDIHGAVLNNTIDSITAEGLASKPSISVCEPGQLIVATRLCPGKTIIAGIECAINQDLKLVHTSFSVEYLSLWFESQRPYFSKLGSGTTVSGIKLEDLDNALVPVPPLEEQGRIVAKVGELLDKIEELR